MDRLPAEVHPAGPRLPGSLRSQRLPSGLEVCVLERPGLGVVSSVLWYRAGTRDEDRGRGGVAHFLEHMMFKGSPHYPSGDVDRFTQRVGGVNNAYTSHDATVYYFQLAAKHWPEALLIEADRMAALDLGDREVESERQVILEEIALYENDPWDALEQAVLARYYGEHPYGRPVLGTRQELENLNRQQLLEFQNGRYRPANAVLVLAGDVAFEEAVKEAAAFVDPPGVALERAVLPEVRPPRTLERLERRRGDLARMLLAVPAPPASSSRYPACRLLATILGGGRSSRLHRALVEDRRMCLWVSAETAELQGPGWLSIALEVMPGTAPGVVENELLKLLAALVTRPPSAAELQRARRMILTDWTFAHERAHQQALAVGQERTVLGEGWETALLDGVREATASDVVEVANRMQPEDGGVIGWSLPRDGR